MRPIDIEPNTTRPVHWATIPSFWIGCVCLLSETIICACPSSISSIPIGDSEIQARWQSKNEYGCADPLRRSFFEPNRTSHQETHRMCVELTHGIYFVLMPNVTSFIINNRDHTLAAKFCGFGKRVQGVHSCRLSIYTSNIYF